MRPCLPCPEFPVSFSSPSPLPRPLLRADPTPTVVDLWPDAAPGEKGDIGEEKDMTKPTDGKPGGKVHHSSRQCLQAHASPSTRPPADKANGTAVVVCPGGGL